MMMNTTKPLIALSTLLTLVACGDAVPRVETGAVGPKGGDLAVPYPEPESTWTKLHSLRFHAGIPVPDAQKWRMDDKSRSELVAIDPSTRSKLVVLFESQPALMNRQRCEARARELGLVPGATLRTIEDAVTVGPEAFDTRVWVAIQAAKGENDPIVGHVIAFGAYVKRCLFVHLTTEVPSGRDESVLSQRLALARIRTVGGITLDNFQDVPREKENH